MEASQRQQSIPNKNRLRYSPHGPDSRTMTTLDPPSCTVCLGIHRSVVRAGMRSPSTKIPFTLPTLAPRFAPVPVSTPGNALSYGIEANLSVTYRNPGDGFFGGITYGVLWPMSALDRGLLMGGSSTNGGFTRTEDASTSQVLRMFLGIKF